ncbi:nmrA-family protein [Mycena metata]|uniref:NmrA-family protein n=1 Tax=Mycena metata TaxID=1033252 RepID=A0AAD7IFQ8_9AGAR|nr:nmrA-family protein [Mycena metata]
MSTSTKLILVLGATGAQGQAVIDALLAPISGSNSPSPYSVRALTRDPASPAAQELTLRGVECVQGGLNLTETGSFTNFDAVAKALEGAYGVWVNTDGFTVGDMVETYAGMRIFELAKCIPTLRHLVWSNLPYLYKESGFNPKYNASHMSGKGRVADWLQAQPSVVADDALSWSIVTSSPYMDMLKGGAFTPLNVRADGTVVFAAPIGLGRVPMIALKDLGWWARWTFDHRAETSARDLGVTSELVDWDHLAQTFTKVTGKPAVAKRLNLEEYWSLFSEDNIAEPIANARMRGDGSATIKENMSAAWRVMRDELFLLNKGSGAIDLEWIHSVHPGTYTLERWIRETGYMGVGEKPVLKNARDGKRNWGLNVERAALL